MTFTNLINRLEAYMRSEIENNVAFIENGIETEKDRGIRRYITETRWNQYMDGTITREAAVEYAIKRMTRQLEKETAEKIAHLNAAAAAPDINYISVSVEWSRGYNPTCEVRTNAGITHGHAGGWGYDKESAAVGTAFNSSDAIMKILYTLKENALAAGGNDYSKSACTHVDNRNIIGYGSGYSVIPYFEGGVGVSCFWSILEKAGFKVTGTHGKYYDSYTLTREDK